MIPAERIIKARIALLCDQPFFGQIALKKMILQERDDIATAAVDGVHLYYNPDFIETLSADELKFLLFHEVLHLAQLHHTRRGNRDAERWNVAGDYVVNAIAQGAGFALIRGALINSAYAGMTTEEVYNLLPPSDGSGSGDSATGEVWDYPGADPQLEEQGTKIDITNAAKAAKMKGKLPASLARLVEELTEARVPWREALQRFLTTSLSRDDYSFRRPNRRFAHTGLILPGLVGEALPPIIVAVDTSGSIRPAELAQFAGEVDGILDCYDATIEVLYCDAKIQHQETFTRDTRPVRMEAKGGGGTDFRPVFTHADEAAPPACLVYLTDMYGTFPPQAPEYPVLWVSTSDTKTAPFGEVIQI